MDMQEAIERLQNYREAALQGNIEEKEKHHDRGKLLARERVELLFDSGTFVQSAMFLGHDFFSEQDKAFGDGVLAGWGDINGRKACVMADDRTVKGGVGPVGRAHYCEILSKALESRVPFITLSDSAGARIEAPKLGPPDQAFPHSNPFRMHVMASGVIPQISAMLGTCAGGTVYGAALSDFIIMLEGIGNMLITGPRVIKEITGEDTTIEELGSAKVHCSISGVADFRVKNEEGCFRLIRNLLSYLPQNCLEKPPIVNTGDSVDRADDDLADIVPVDDRKAYDVKEVVRRVVDCGELLEVKADFAKNYVTGFARLNGQSVGICANQPLHMAGALTIDSADKQSQFIRFCDAFNIPIIFFVDNPGYLPGVQQEHGGIIRHGARNLYAIAEATVPKISVRLRKQIGGGISGSGGDRAMGIDRVFSWPIACFGAVGPEASVEMMYRKEIQNAENPEAFRQQKIDEIRRVMSGPYLDAAVGELDEVIQPRETRQRLIQALEFLKNKEEVRYYRKHGLTPL